MHLFSLHNLKKPSGRNIVFLLLCLIFFCLVKNIEFICLFAQGNFVFTTLEIAIAIVLSTLFFFCICITSLGRKACKYSTAFLLFYTYIFYQGLKSLTIIKYTARFFPPWTWFFLISKKWMPHLKKQKEEEDDSCIYSAPHTNSRIFRAPVFLLYKIAITFYLTKNYVLV